MSELSDKPVALVTGARRGIGRAICYALAEHGFNLVVNDLLDGPDMEVTLTGVEARHARALALVRDIADLATHEELIQQALDYFGRLDCLVNNAGVSALARGDLLDVSVESYDRCLNTNLRGTFFLTQRFASYLLASAPPNNQHYNQHHSQHRAIITISSANAETVSISRGEYCMSKTGLAMMSKLFAARLAEADIGVYEVRPGIIATEMTAPVQHRYDQLIAEGGVPMPRWGQPDDVAQTVATLASGALPYCTGETINIDGGLHLRRL